MEEVTQENLSNKLKNLLSKRLFEIINYLSIVLMACIIWSAFFLAHKYFLFLLDWSITDSIKNTKILYNLYSGFKIGFSLLNLIGASIYLFFTFIHQVATNYEIHLGSKIK